MSDTSDSDTAPDTDEPVTPPPPAEVASADALPSGDGGAITVRDRKFNVVGVMPGMALIDIAQAQRKLNDTSRNTADNDPKRIAAGMDATAAFGDALVNSIVEEERGDFKDYLRTAYPPIGIEEMRDVLSEALRVINGRPTQPASLSPGG